MATEDTMVLLMAAPAAAYREYLYRPHGELARWISNRFETVARPGERTGERLRDGDVLIEVALGRPGPGQCRSLAGSDRERLAGRRHELAVRVAQDAQKQPGSGSRHFCHAAAPGRPPHRRRLPR